MTNDNDKKKCQGWLLPVNWGAIQYETRKKCLHLQCSEQCNTRPCLATNYEKYKNNLELH